MEVSRQTDMRLKTIVTASTHGLTLIPISPLLHGSLRPWHIGWVMTGVYKIESSGGMWSDEQFAMLNLPDWERIIRRREGAAVSLIFSRANDESLRSMIVLTKEGDQLVIVKVSGRLDKVIEDLPRISDLPGLFHIGRVFTEGQSDYQS
jgi:hypothetical protein